MNILFISYAQLSLHGEGVRAVAMVRALADAGHRVDLLSPHSDLPDHPHIRVLGGGGENLFGRGKIRTAAMRAAGRVSYDAIHAVDESVFFAARLCRWKKIPLVYDASRCFSGKAGAGAPKLWKLFPNHFQRMEAKVMERAEIIFSSCSALTADLCGIDKDAAVVQLEDVPMQSLYARRGSDTSTLFASFEKRPNPVVVCSVLPGDAIGYRNLLLAARKVIDALPGTAFYFNGASCEQAEKMAANLDIAGRCIFLAPGDPNAFLAALDIADAILLVPQQDGRYIHPLVYTLLHAGAPLVTLHAAAYDEILAEKNSVRVLSSAESIADGLLRVIREPLFSLAVATEGQHLVANRYTYSSFKHKVRMAYYKLFKQE
ncbi:MAG: glycosyltransferase [Kiritimatiellales bacterium]|nr:glycosyltransferase [Kiritimatiellales bacterium]MCF7863257.1 glycosyltransferase [Kiritimatiellales bacterium]